jgi:hypothetical protein
MALGAAVSLIWRPRRAGWTNCLGAAATALPDPLMSAGAPLPAVMAGVVGAACGLSMYVVAWQTAIQQHIPADQQGRVSAFTDIAEISLTPVGYLMVLPVTGAIGVRGTLLACRVILAAANLTPLLSRDVRELTLVGGGPRVEPPAGDPSPDVPTGGPASPSVGQAAEPPGRP